VKKRITRRASVIGMGAMVALLVEFGAPAPLAAQEATRSAWDGVYTVEQAERGELAFKDGCSSCHLAEEFYAPSFLESRLIGQNLSSLFGYLRNMMPYDAPGTLPGRTYVNVLAYLLQLNGFPAGETDLPGTTARLSTIQVPALEDRSP
jgi:S-disulfanyl-L-cysteine oxidoreductase SoxD